ncbi:hypothetical protein BDF20DRAFT_894430 [Mycotypha africana]|uniref:uncharacterized protein n=1 Tax=Mycotypha africana TaxID=64632 RepID=UPI002300DE0D|nr:uncharacterized protein BDF20DRAFT_894430 [Mycotypha africana]KAI8969316.1 hypothetical protein BDF20DRAFT_894430 [Mycotypha africana]
MGEKGRRGQITSVHFRACQRNAIFQNHTDPVYNSMPPKNDVRKLFKKQQAERNKAVKIKHPFAKYDEMGRLLCIVCQSAVKSENVWQAHLGSAFHLENIQKLKAIKQKQQQQQQQQQHLKRRAPSPSPQMEEDQSEEEVEHKRLRLEPSTQNEKQGIELDEEASDNDDEIDENTAQLPADFFDQKQEDLANDPMDEGSATEESNTLPAGFFDDPDEDARMRGELLPEEKAKVDLEKDVQSFTEAMADVTEESKQAQEEDDETFWQERHFDLTMEQAAFDSRVAKLRHLREAGKNPENDSTANNPSHEETDDIMRVKLKTNVRQALKGQLAKHAVSVFDDDLDDISEEEEEDWRAQQL